MAPTIISINTQQSPTSDSRSEEYTDDTASTGTGEHVPLPTISDHESSDIVEDQSWEGIDAEDFDEDIIEPSESASRPRAGPRYRSESRPAPAQQRHRVRRAATEHTVRHASGHRQHSRGPRPAPDAPSSVEDYDQYPAYGRPYPSMPYGRGGYPQSHAGGYAANPFQADPRHSSAMMPFQSPGAFQQYPPANPFSPAASDPRATGYFGHHTPGTHVHHGYTGHEVAPYGPPQAYGYGAYGPPPGMNPHFYDLYQHAAPQAAPSRSKTPAADTPAKEAAPAPIDPKIAKEQEELKIQLAQLKLENDTVKKEKEARDAADKKKLEDEATKKANDARVLEEVTKARLKVLEEAAAAEEKAKADAEKAKQAAEAQKKAEAEMKVRIEGELKEKAEKDAKEAAAKAPPPEEKKKPIRFKDAVGRKFSFPFHLCATWAGMEDLIKQAFLHVEVIGPHVADGHYDLVGPNGEIILPQVWETMIEPDWQITMHMWPMPERPKPPGDGPIILEGGQPGHSRRPDRAGRGTRVGGPPPGDRPAGRRSGAIPVPPSHGDVAPGIIRVDSPPPRKKKTATKPSGFFSFGGGSKSKGKAKK